MSYNQKERFNLPAGGTTTDQATYVDSWESYALPICKKFGYSLVAFDPDFRFVNENGKAMDIPAEFVVNVVTHLMDD